MSVILIEEEDFPIQDSIKYVFSALDLGCSCDVPPPDGNTFFYSGSTHIPSKEISWTAG